MSGTYPVSIIDEWRTMRDVYDLDQTKPNPYEEVDSRTSVFLHGFLPPPNLLPDVTMAKLRMELAKEEAKELLARAPLRKVSAGVFFCKAMDAEERQ